MMPRSFHRTANAVRLLLAVQRRSGFLHIYLGLAILTVAGIRVFLPGEWASVVVPAVLLGEYGTMGVYLVAAQRFMERNERSTAALVVTPLEGREHVLAMILAPTLVAIVSGAVVFAGVLGIDWRVGLLVLPLGLTAALAGAVGLLLSSFYTEFTRFLLGSIPVVAVFSLPFLSYFRLTPRYSFAWLPWDAAIFSFANLARPDPELRTYFLLAAELAAFTVLALAWAAAVFQSRVRERLDAAP